ncbi:hypothetical protein ADUPG1_008564 [Aduncisulcus paluster]|uniref:Phosphatidylinositol-3,4,5-trisphosphate 3-phosphatase n=1 Tax=Aduncisulcus paluster TaxID=2918883 RepID=A0ABQ5KSF3_9EUKA|nr:hypothetical protein ADUPG1_008564 [Aduncisulcus paluster]
MKSLRHAVSQNKKRYKDDKFDLDLSYITSRIIAMGFPATGGEALYRNPYKDVKDFLDTKHPRNHRVYNLCSESHRQYTSTFHEYAWFPFPDHNPPPFQYIELFCRNVEDYLMKDPKNIIAVHCKAGKSRTGTMICCFLLHSHFSSSALSALTYYGKARTSNGHGVTIPSQRRYIFLYEEYLKRKRAYELKHHSSHGVFPYISQHNILDFSAIKLKSAFIGPFYNGIKKIKLRIVKFSPLYYSDDAVHVPKGHEIVIECPISSKNNTAMLSLSGTDGLFCGDILVQMYVTGKLYNSESKRYKKAKHYYLGQFWLNTAFLDQNISMDVGTIDKLCKKSRKRYVPGYFSVSLGFIRLNPLSPHPERPYAMDDEVKLALAEAKRIVMRKEVLKETDQDDLIGQMAGVGVDSKEAVSPDILGMKPLDSVRIESKDKSDCPKEDLEKESAISRKEDIDGLSVLDDGKESLISSPILSLSSTSPYVASISSSEAEKPRSYSLIGGLAGDRVALDSSDLDLDSRTKDDEMTDEETDSETDRDPLAEMDRAEKPRSYSLIGGLAGDRVALDSSDLDLDSRTKDDEMTDEETDSETDRDPLAEMDRVRAKLG